MKKISEKIPPLKKQKLSKKSQDKENKIKGIIQMENQSWHDWIFQIHWINIEWVITINCSEGKDYFCTSSNIFYLKDNNKTSHWVGNFKLKPLYLEESY